MSPLSGTSQRLQNAIYNLRVVQGNFQGVQDSYTAASTDATASNTDMNNTKKPMSTILKDRGDISVAADGKTLLGLVAGTVKRFRKTEGSLMMSKQNADNAAFPLQGLRQELVNLAQTAQNPQVAQLIGQSIQFLDEGGSYHGWAARDAGWSRSSAIAGEAKLAMPVVGNSLPIVAKDNDQGKNVAGDMANAKPFIDQAIGFAVTHAAQMKDTVSHEGSAIACLAEAQSRLAQALALSQPTPPPQPPAPPTAPSHHPSLQDILHANDPNRPH